MDEGLTADQSVQAHQTETLNVFHSDLRWFAGAAAIQIVALILILPVFYGWWKIGLPDLTLSPFHLAKLFDAPLLRDVNSNTGARGIVRDVGSLPVKLGLVETPTYPDTGFNELSTMGLQRRASRVGIAESQRVAVPWKGMRFTK
jgi:hypothetical protein